MPEGEESIAGREHSMWERRGQRKHASLGKGQKSRIPELEMGEIKLEVAEQEGQAGPWEPR